MVNCECVQDASASGVIVNENLHRNSLAWRLWCQPRIQNIGRWSSPFRPIFKLLKARMNFDKWCRSVLSKKMSSM